jgi:GxxExxY protein
MPVYCDHTIARLTTDEFRELDYRVMRLAFDSHNELGRLADERIYQADLTARLKLIEMQVHREVELRVVHKNFCKSFYLDLVIASSAIYELKVASSLRDAHVGQLLNYLMLLDLAHGKVINFGASKVESRFVNTPLASEFRRNFRVEAGEYNGQDQFLELVLDLLRDWGTSLSLTLYKEAIVSLLGGIETVEILLPFHRDGILLGNQRYQLAGPEIGFTLTAMTKETTTYRRHLSRLIKHSPLRAIHWVNIAYDSVFFSTITSS